MITHVFLRYAIPGQKEGIRNWSPRTSYPVHPTEVRKRILPIIKEEYQKPADCSKPVGMLLVYFDSSKTEEQIPKVFEYTIEMLEPRIVSYDDEA